MRNVLSISTNVLPNLETRLGTVPAVLQVMQSSSEQETRSEVLNLLCKPPARRTIHPRRRLGPVNQTTDTTSGTRSETTKSTTSTSREEQPPDSSSLMWSRPISSPWHIYKQDLMKMNLQTMRFAADAIRMLNGASLSAIGLYPIVALDWLIAARINFSSTTSLRITAC